ncbi:hypothetical protein [Antrihabitans cavernicola]|uniref:Uncharacterized protein n=1 Tax=Antrihabitans cavernicola TaxID=2495913 RepID=A0A5A7S9C3_9NOCA|nr:hypothetical protein [Spelaeibacter cavernicola]KAA0021839.1 hypothetical protein FOY51_15695 [Spelaeibacter cavernicola]
MRSFVHLLLFVCAIGLAVGSFLPVIGRVVPTNVALVDLRDGFGPGWGLDQIADRSVTFYTSMNVLLLGAAVLLLLAGLIGWRIAGWLGVVLGFGTLGVFAWRLNANSGQMIRDNYSTLLADRWGLNLVGGALVIALLACLVPRGA